MGLYLDLYLDHHLELYPDLELHLDLDSTFKKYLDLLFWFLHLSFFGSYMKITRCFLIFLVPTLWKFFLLVGGGVYFCIFFCLL